MGLGELWSWQRRIARAEELARASDGAAQLLTQYAAILTAQATCYDALLAHRDRLTGTLERDLPDLRAHASEIFASVSLVAPAQTMQDVPTDVSGIEALLRSGWHARDIPFLARIVLQPYAEALATFAQSKDLRHGRAGHDADYASAGTPGAERDLEREASQAACPFCGGPPQVAVLRGDSTADGAGRALVCATCSTTWPVRRIMCVSCGEENERQLNYFQAAEFDHVRLDGCEACRRYIKTVDLTRLGRAVPVVDEIASAVLDLWASEHGFIKVARNVIGL